MENCKHLMIFPVKTSLYEEKHCGFYSKHTIKGKHWAHYPECKPENCPLIHPELLGDAVLEAERS